MRLQLSQASAWLDRIRAQVNTHSNSYFYNVTPADETVITATSDHGHRIICKGFMHEASIRIETHNSLTALEFLGAVSAASMLINYEPAHNILNHAASTHAWIRLQDEPCMVAQPIHRVQLLLRPEEQSSADVTADGSHVSYSSLLRAIYSKCDTDMIAAYVWWEWISRHPDPYIRTHLPGLLTAATLTGEYA